MLPRPSEAARSKEESEYKVKAAAVYHVIRYTTWPEHAFEDPRSPIVVLVVGGNPFGDHLEVALKDKLIGARPIELRASPQVPDELDAHLVFEGRLEPSARRRLLELTRGRSCLSTGDRPGYAKEGACANLLIEKGKLVIEINTTSVAEAELEISSQLLKLARRVEGRQEDGR